MQVNPDISTYAFDFSGYTVAISYYDMDGTSHWLDTDTLDLTDPEIYRNGVEDGRLYMCYRFTFPESIKRGTVIDFLTRFYTINASIEFDKASFQNSNWASVSGEYTCDTDWTNRSTDISYVSLQDVSSQTDSFDKLYLYFWITPDDGATTFRTEMIHIETTEVSSNGLLSSIIEWIKSIYEGIVNLPSKIANSLKTFFDNIVNAVTNIGNLIKNAIVDLGNFLIDGIKNLFIPSEEDITKMKDKWDTLLSDRFGALYQVASLISDYASAFTEQNKNTITFPSVSIPLAGAEFTFGGWEVQIVPDGFEIVFDTLKLITSILATFLFVNGMKKRFDKLLGGADDI